MTSESLPRLTPELSPVDRWCRRLTLQRLACLRGGQIRLIDGLEEQSLGVADGSSLRAIQLNVHDPRFYRRLAAGGSLGAGESYIDGDWDADDLTGLVQLMARDQQTTEGLEGGVARLWGLLESGLHRLLRDNTQRGSRRNIAAHYDLGNQLFGEFLDSRLQYSSAVYESPADDLEQASTNKLDRICAKLELGPGDHLLEIGTGWGGLAIHAAQQTGCRVTTVTISAEQHALARQRVEQAGLWDRIEVRFEDYRQLQGRFSKVVSVEMVEAVGDNHLDEYFAVIDRCLAADGLALIQAITIADRRYSRALRDVDFIKKHIFPGSFIPAVSVLCASAARSSRLVLVNLEDLADDYARTLADWRERFEHRWPRIRALGYDERFRRMWRFYLAYCEGGFRERSIANVQMLLAAPLWRGRPWRAQTVASGCESYEATRP
jgi:cyclopropane-fatty-acyl-phospholipid synthase